MKNQAYYFSIFLLVCIFAYSYAVVSKNGITTIGVGHSPAGIAITPDCECAYIADSNHEGVPGGNAVSVVDLKTCTIKKVISDPSFKEPYTITINKAGTTIYVTNSTSSTVSIIDRMRNEVIGIIDGFDGPSGMVITPDDTRAYVNNFGHDGGIGNGKGTTVSVIDLATNSVIGAITVDLAPASLAITPDGAFVYVINYVDGNPGKGTISIIQTSTNTVVGTIPGFSGPFGIAITPNGNYAYVTNFGSNDFSPIGDTVSVVNLTNNTLEKTIKVGIQPAGIAITPDGRFAYVSNYNTLYKGPNFTNLTPGKGVIDVIDTTSHEVVASLDVDDSPDVMAISPDGKYACVNHYTCGKMSIIKLLQ